VRVVYLLTCSEALQSHDQTAYPTYKDLKDQQEWKKNTIPSFDAPIHTDMEFAARVRSYSHLSVPVLVCIGSTFFHHQNPSKTSLPVSSLAIQASNHASDTTTHHTPHTTHHTPHTTHHTPHTKPPARFRHNGRDQEDDGAGPRAGPRPPRARPPPPPAHPAHPRGGRGR
jgi:hypothetical protein